MAFWNIFIHIIVVNGYFTNGLTDVHTPGTPLLVIQPNTIIDYNSTTAGYTDDTRHFHIVNTGLTEASVEIDIIIVNWSGIILQDFYPKRPIQ